MAARELERAAPVPTRGAYRYFVAGFLALVYALNFMDRQIVAILQEPIRLEFGLSDSQLGLLTGLAFALFYTSFGIPVAWLADRYRRVPIMAAACAIWSLFTALCGVATSFVHLLLARIMVGAGEAGGAPPAYSLLSDYFGPEERGKAMGIFSLGAPLGAALGAALGGWLASEYGWRTAFIVVGAPGILFAIAMLFTIREPERGALDIPSANRGEDSFLGAIRAFVVDRTMMLNALSAAMAAFVGYALLAWNPSFLTRAKGMTLEDIASYYSLVLGITGIFGIVTAGWLADRLARYDRRWYAWLPAAAFVLTIPGIVGAIFAPSWQYALLFLSIPALLSNMYIAPALAIVQNNTPPERRTMASATLVFLVALIGLGGGPLYLGAVSDMARARWGDGSLETAYAALIPPVILTIALLMLTARSIGRDHSHEMRSS